MGDSVDGWDKMSRDVLSLMRLAAKEGKAGLLVEGDALRRAILPALPRDDAARCFLDIVTALGNTPPTTISTPSTSTSAVSAKPLAEAVALRQ